MDCPRMGGVWQTRLDSRFRGNDGVGAGVAGGVMDCPRMGGVWQTRLDSRFRGNDEVGIAGWGMSEGGAPGRG